MTHGGEEEAGEPERQAGDRQVGARGQGRIQSHGQRARDEEITDQQLPALTVGQSGNPTTTRNPGVPMERPAKEAEKAIKDLEPQADDVKGGRLRSNVQKKMDDTISGQQQKIG
jgi:hypothetical protein